MRDGCGAPRELRLLLEEYLARYTRNWKPLIEVDASRFDAVIVVGDTHGYPNATIKALRAAEEAGQGIAVFLGDYVDRGPYGVENLTLVLEAVIRGSAIALRGNHESLHMNMYYGFYDEIVNKLGHAVIQTIADFYRALPLAALLRYGRGRNVFLVHGGIPCKLCLGGEEKPLTIDELMEIAKSSDVDPLENPTALQLLWNDPRADIEWFAPSIRGPGIYYYGRKAWTEFMRVNNIAFMLRAHEAVDGIEILKPDGDEVKPLDREKLNFSSLFGSVVTVFSSLYHGLRSAIIMLDGESLEVTYIK
ncbi:MAG: metallophosphoesterase [Thermoproteota archaeon]